MVEIARKKRAQEEMVGFALIIILVAVIFLVFLGFSLRNQEKKNVESYEVESFLQSLLQYTTKCENNVERLSVRKLISSCYAKEKCLDEKNSCDVLKSDLTRILYLLQYYLLQFLVYVLFWTWFFLQLIQ